MRKSISKRLFLISFGTIVFLICFTMLFQILFFQEFYLKRKSSNLALGVKQFKTLYSYDIDNKQSLYNALGLFEMEHNAKIAVYSTDGTVKYLADPDGSNTEVINTLNQVFKQLYNDPLYAQSVLESDGVFTKLMDNQSFHSKYIVCMAPFSLSSEKDSIVIALTSFQIIEEATSIIKDFYKYILIVVVILGLILSYIYSDLIAKPLVRINKTAKKLSAMDFSERCVVDRDDEIGNLAETLNFLSKNLSNALDDLKIKNAKLKEEVENERRLEKLRKDFIAGVSHELKTPIGIISGYAEGLKDGIADEESQGIYLDIIMDEAKKMNKLVMDMLELAKLENGNTELSLTSFSLNMLVDEVLFKNSVDISNSKLTIKKIYRDNLNYTVTGDEFKIEQVVTNFITNAIKYTPENNTIIVDIHEHNELVYCSIENTGTNIPEENLEKIWHQFYRGDSSRNRDSRSTGLGLSIVKNILQLHNSYFGAINTANGVKFYFTLTKGK